MRQIDLLIGGVIVLAIVFSFVGVATYEAASPDTQFDIIWNAQSVDLAAKQEQQTGNNANGRTIEFPIDVQNLTKVDLKVRITGAGPRPAAVTLRVSVEPVNATAPEQKTATLTQGAQAASQEFDFSVQVREAPNQTQASGPNDNETAARLATEHTSNQGSGVWKVKVIITGGQTVPVVGTGAEQYTIVVSGKATRYEASLQPTTPDINR